MRRVAHRTAAALTLTIGLLVIIAFGWLVSTAGATSPSASAAALGVATPAYGWVIQLRGAVTKDLTSTQFAALERKVGASWKDPSGDTWSGVPLWRLVGLVDDANPATFSSALAAKGYRVQVVGLDGHVVTLVSTDKSWVRSRTTIVAAAKNGVSLAFGSFSTDDPGTWVPAWPAQLVSAGLPADETTGGVVKIIVYKHGVTPPAKPAIQPGWIVQVRGATKRDYTATQFHTLASKHTASWTDTSVTPSAVYAGTPLWRLVALADGGSPATLNLDRLGLGYKIDVYGMGVDGLGADAPTVATFDASAIAGNGSVIIADRRDGRQLTPLQGAVSQPDLWTPTWPARIVGTGVAGGQSNGGVVRVTLEKPVIPSYIKPLVLSGRRTARIAYLDFPTPVTWDGTKAGNINPTLRAVYRGQSLYKLVGLVDDSHPKSFNTVLARKGYKIEFIGSDGYTWTISSKTIVGRKRWIVASLKNGAVMASDEGPYRYVGSFVKPFYGKPSVFKLVKIRLIF